CAGARASDSALPPPARSRRAPAAALPPVSALRRGRATERAKTRATEEALLHQTYEPAVPFHSTRSELASLERRAPMRSRTRWWAVAWGGWGYATWASIPIRTTRRRSLTRRS